MTSANLISPDFGVRREMPDPEQLGRLDKLRPAELVGLLLFKDDFGGWAIYMQDGNLHQDHFDRTEVASYLQIMLKCVQ